MSESDTPQQRCVELGRVVELERALKYGAASAINGLIAQGLPPEWSYASGIGTMLRALGCDSLTLDESARKALNGEK